MDTLESVVKRHHEALAKLINLSQNLTAVKSEITSVRNELQMAEDELRNFRTDALAALNHDLIWKQ